MEMKKFNYMIEIHILRNSLQKFLGVLRAEGLVVQKDTQTPCWLRPKKSCLLPVTLP